MSDRKAIATVELFSTDELRVMRQALEHYSGFSREMEDRNIALFISSRVPWVPDKPQGGEA